jgi:hypothetical protein
MMKEIKTMYYANTNKEYQRQYMNMVETILEIGERDSYEEHEYFYYAFYNTMYGAFRILIDKDNHKPYTVTAFEDTWKRFLSSGVIKHE